MENHSAGSSGLVRFCDLCNKPITTNAAYKRHVTYCRRAQSRPRKRQRSCMECHSAKVKCSFEPTCHRCSRKGLHCVYEQTAITPAANTAGTLDNASGQPAANDLSVATLDSSVYGLLISGFGASSTLKLPDSSPRSADELRADPIAQHGVRFVLEAVWGLPFMMTNRETFSWFSHGYWYHPELPRTIATCSDLARLYSNRGHVTDDAFWNMVDEENRRLLRDLPGSSVEEVIYGLQAQIIYMIMFALDSRSANEIPRVRLQMLMVFELYCKRCTTIIKGFPFVVEDLTDTNVTWESWVHAETRRRFSITWFLMSRVIDLKFGVLCSSVVNCRSLPIPCPEQLWRARTEEEWENLRRVKYRDYDKCSIRTFGDLIAARSCPPDSERGRDLRKWYAISDKLGLLLTFAATMI
ncbi:hypothetical protein GGS23DRAFT_341796 [Durotheca rogersii]|uniref:uncharacterized protein n=1 Tax=Durotheca rogersii TaxID=419775 RepID=UPI00221EDA27|nr:uncharacterized protein GGS23DRAFT_341796 [Durotheca rogersii]KAI5857430.1 hypothetical protein GGS23DRAFT_341796 [Durotheca rogersii]